MKSSAVPKLMGVAFGVNGSRQDLQDTLITGSSLASYDSGFPPITMISTDAGGIPPQGKDFNEIFYELSADAQWSQASGIYPYDATFSTSIGGYPKGAVVIGTDGITIYQNTADDNTVAPGVDSTWTVIPGDSSKLVGADDLSSQTGYSMIGKVSSYAKLKLLIPSYAGQVVVTSSYIEGYNKGGNTYIAVSGTFSEDGGATAYVNSSWSWKIVKDVDKLNAYDFGALNTEIYPSYDSTTAIQNLALYISSLGSPIYGTPINIGVGTYNITNIDTSTTSTGFPFRLHGSGNYEHGRQTPTILNILGANDTYAITTSSHIVEICNIGITGGYATSANTRKFITSKTRPEWLRVSKFYAGYTGGVIFDFLDSLDTKFDQFYTEYTYDSVIKILPSETATWTISTAIELSNFNIQYHKGGSSAKPAILAPLSYYGLITNGWIEHSDYPANIAYGMWNINSFAIESTTYPVYAYMARVKDAWADYKLANGLDFTLGATEVSNLGLTIPSWAIDNQFNGRLIQQPAFTLNYGSHGCQQSIAVNRLSNASGWIYLGDFTPRYTSQGIVVEIQGGLQYNSESLTKTSSTGSGSGVGVCKIRIQNKGTVSVPVSWNNENSSAITDVKWVYSGSSSYIVSIYVNVRQYSNSLGIFVRTDGDTPTYISGVTSYWVFKGTAISDITTVTGLVSAPSFASFHNNTYGFGMNLNAGYMTIDTPVTYAEGTSGSLRTLKTYINSTAYNIPLIGSAMNLPAYAKASLPSATTAANKYGAVIVTDGSSSSTACVAFSDGTNWIRVSDSAVLA